MNEVKLLKHCASDLDVVNAARVSFGKRHDAFEPGDGKLIWWLMRKRHGTPFEHGYFQFFVAVPIFAQRDWMRHRAGHSFNEISTRYTELPEAIYAPELLREQKGKPGDYHYEDFDPLVASVDERFKHWRQRKLLIAGQKLSYKLYRSLLKRGVAKEQAMALLPMGLQTQFYWSCNPRSLMHFLSLRTAPDVRKEIREIAEQVEVEFARVMPVTHKAFVENGRVAP